MAQYPFTTNADILRSIAPDVANKMQAVRKKVRECGPIDDRTRELMLLCAFAAARIDTGFIIHCKIARSHGATYEECVQAAIMGIGATQGLWPTVDAVSWVKTAWQESETGES